MVTTEKMSVSNLTDETTIIQTHTKGQDHHGPIAMPRLGIDFLDLLPSLILRRPKLIV
jgi:hypothetical protein